MYFGLSVRARNSKTIAPIYIIFYTINIVLMARSSPKFRTLRDRTKYAITYDTTSNVRYNEEKNEL